MKTPAVLAVVWLIASVGFIVWNVQRVIHIGRMTLPREQAGMLSVLVVVMLSIIGLWVWMLIDVLLRRWQVQQSWWFMSPPLRWAVAASAAFVIPLGLYARYVEPRWTVVRQVALGSATSKQAPVRIAVLSDLHVDRAREPYLSLAGKVNALEPDLVLFLGDSLNRADALPVLHQVLGDIKAPHGKFAVRGNWEAWYWNNLPVLESTGFRWVDGEPVDLMIRDQQLRIAGLAYRDGQDGKKGEQALAGAPMGSWRLFLYHTPDLVEDVPSADLVLAGHTHGGQVSIPGFGALVTLSKFGKRFERGLSFAGTSQVYVTPGIGVEPAVPFRLGVRPEITLVLLSPRS